MKRVLLFLVLSSVALASAAQAPEPTSVEVRGSMFQLPAQPYPVFREDLVSYSGVYHLTNGERMLIRRAGRRLFAEIGDLPAKEMVATSSNEFVALDRQARLAFEPGGYISGEMLVTTPLAMGASRSEWVRLVAAR